MRNITNRFIPEDSKEKANITSESIMMLLKDKGYKNIILSFSEEHPDRFIEDEEISYVFCSPMSVERIKEALWHLSEHMEMGGGK